MRNISACHIAIPRHTPVGDLEIYFIEEPLDAASRALDATAAPVDFERL